MTTTLDVSEIGPQLLQLLEAQNDEEIVLTRDGAPVARVLPLASRSVAGLNGSQENGTPEKKPRVLGLHAGMGWISDDFNDELPDEFWFGSELEGYKPENLPDELQR